MSFALPLGGILARIWVVASRGRILAIMGVLAMLEPIGGNSVAEVRLGKEPLTLQSHPLLIVHRS